MSIEFWIILLVTASAISGWIGFTYARRGAPSQAEMDALEQELDQARQQAETVQSGVNEHFEQSAVLFGNLAKDYREFLEHFSESAQSLGLPASRARELLEKGFQPLLVHEEVSHEEDVDETLVDVAPETATPEPPLMEDVVITPEEITREDIQNEQLEIKAAEEAVAGLDPLRTDIIVEMPDEDLTDDAGTVASYPSDDTSDAQSDNLDEAVAPEDSTKQHTG